MDFEFSWNDQLLIGSFVLAQEIVSTKDHFDNLSIFYTMGSCKDPSCTDEGTLID